MINKFFYKMGKLLNFLSKPEDQSLNTTQHTASYVQPIPPVRVKPSVEPTFILQRFIKDQDGTLGAVFFSDRPILNQTPICLTLELPWENNKNKESCILPGDYELSWEYSPHFKRNLFEFKNTPGRAECKFHPANVISELEGCIAPCTFFAYNTIHTDGKKYKYYAAQSTKAVAALESVLPKSGCIMSVRDPEQFNTSQNPTVQGWVNRLFSSSYRG